MLPPPAGMAPAVGETDGDGDDDDELTGDAGDDDDDADCPDGASPEGRVFDGTIDELRLARAARSPAFMQTQFRSVTDTLLDYGEIETRPPQCE